MKWRLGLLLAVGCIGQAVWAVPNQITYQGTLKQNGVPMGSPTPVSVNMQFSFVDGNNSYHLIPGTNSIPISNVSVSNGLFSVQIPLPSTGTVDWSQYNNPYLQISIDGQTLNPPQPISSDLYSIVSQTVMDGAITTTKLAPPVQAQLIPSGMIAMFATSCPSGWNTFTALEGRFPVGQDPNNPNLFTIGQSSGSLTHNHLISTDGSHTHRLADGIYPISGQSGISAGVAVLGGQSADGQLVAAGGGGTIAQQKLSTTDPSGAHNHGGKTGSSSTLPPYLTVVFCQKL